MQGISNSPKSTGRKVYVTWWEISLGLAAPVLFYFGFLLALINPVVLTIIASSILFFTAALFITLIINYNLFKSEKFAPLPQGGEILGLFTGVILFGLGFIMLPSPFGLVLLLGGLGIFSAFIGRGYIRTKEEEAEEAEEAAKTATTEEGTEASTTPPLVPTPTIIPPTPNGKTTILIAPTSHLTYPGDIPHGRSLHIKDFIQHYADHHQAVKILIHTPIIDTRDKKLNLNEILKIINEENKDKVIKLLNLIKKADLNHLVNDPNSLRDKWALELINFRDSFADTDKELIQLINSIIPAEKEEPQRDHSIEKKSDKPLF